MTVNDAAKQYGISKQMVYRILNKSGEPINTLKDPESGLLTDAGMAILADRYSKRDTSVNKVDNKLIDSLQTELTETKAALAAALAERDAMKAANEALAAQIVTANDKYTALQEEHEKLHAHLTSAFDTIKNMSTLALPIVNETKPKKKHWWNRA